jgi:hypothetical protein
MARVLTRSNRPIVIQEPQSGLDTFLTEIAKYASPEYQQQRKMNERADARFELDKQNAIQNREYRQQQMEIAKSQENDRAMQARQRRKDAIEKKAMDEFSIMYPETLSAEGLDIAEQFLNTNLASSSSYGVLSAKIKSDRNNLNINNQKLDSLGEFIYEDEYDPNKHRALVENQGSFLIQNKMKQEMFGELSSGDRIALNADISLLSDGIKTAREQELLSQGSYENYIKKAVIPTYESMKKAYGEDFTMPSLEGIIRGVDPTFGVDDSDISSEETERIDTQPSQETIPESRQTADYIQLANQGILEPEKIIDSLADKGEGSLGMLESAAKEGSVAVPVTKELRKAVKASRSDLNKASANVAKSYAFGSDKSVSPEARSQNIEQLKTALVNAVNLYKSIDPQQGRAKTLITPAGGKSERRAIKKSIDKLKTLIDRSKFRAGSLKHLPEDIKSFIRNIDLEGVQDNRMMAEDDGSFFESLLPTALQARQDNIPSPLDNFIFESATE